MHGDLMFLDEEESELAELAEAIKCRADAYDGLDDGIRSITKLSSSSSELVTRSGLAISTPLDLERFSEDDDDAALGPGRLDDDLEKRSLGAVDINGGGRLLRSSGISLGTTRGADSLTGLSGGCGIEDADEDEEHGGDWAVRESLIILVSWLTTLFCSLMGEEGVIRVSLVEKELNDMREGIVLVDDWLVAWIDGIVWDRRGTGGGGAKGLLRLFVDGLLFENCAGIGVSGRLPADDDRCILCLLLLLLLLFFELPDLLVCCNNGIGADVWVWS